MITEAEIEKLKSVEIVVRRRRKLQVLNAHTVYDEEFIEWVAKKMKGRNNIGRLRFRLEILRSLERFREK